ncbi:hypothetical protein TNCV_3902091 [Trichonephila clavipes]|nr:hypothetical protein TNCV_3902091 [Trichonephila clavipes]
MNVIEGIVMEAMVSIQRKHRIMRKQKANHCPLFFRVANRQWSNHGEPSATLQRLREKMSDIFYSNAFLTFNICDPFFNHSFHCAPPYNNYVLNSIIQYFETKAIEYDVLSVTGVIQTSHSANALIALDVYTRLPDIPSFLRTAIYANIQKALECKKRTLTVSAKDLLISEDFLICSFSTPPPLMHHIR